MPSEYDNDLLREGILHYRVKEFDTARTFIERALENADDQETRAQANYYLSLLSDDPIQKRKYLEETLAIDMTHAEARRALAVLDGKLKAKDIIDPDRMAAPVTGSGTVPADRFTCPKCGGRMVFSPDGAELICEYCNQNRPLSTIASSMEQDFIVAMANGSGQRNPVAFQTFRCQGCGATFFLAPDEISATCAYCGSVHVIALDQKLQLIEPDSILPMVLDLNQATRHFADWVATKKVSPQEQVKLPRGLYLPVWTFDIIGSIPWNGMVYRDKQEVPVSGQKEITSNDVRISGSKKLADLIVDTLPEFDLSHATAYDARFLAGWMADIYDLPMAEASLEARQIVVEHMRAMIHQEFGQVHNLGYTTFGVLVSGFKLILVPIWVTEIKIHDKIWPVLINGRTGSVHCKIPERGISGWLDTMLGTNPK